MRSRTWIAGVSPSDRPGPNAMPSTYSSAYARIRATRYSALSDGWRATRSESVSYTPRSTSERSTSKVCWVEVSATPRLYPARAAALSLWVDDVDATYAKALAAGATSESEPEDKPYGHRGAGVVDQNGITWWIGAPIT